MERDRNTYIGDGIYAQDLGHDVRFHTPREQGDHFIHFGPAEIWSTLRWLRLRGWIPDEAIEQLRAYTPDGPEELKEDDLGGLDHAED